MLLINANTIKNNIINITKKFNKIPAFVLKSNAYGLGINNILPILLNTYNDLTNTYEGLLQIFVRDVFEGKVVRKIHEKYIKNNLNLNINTTNINIIILNSITTHTIKYYKKYQLTALINHMDDLHKFKAIFQSIPTILNIDVGMNRMGVKYEHISMDIINEIKSLNIIGIMAHLHITDEKNKINNINYVEKDKFNNIIKEFKYIKNITLASSNVLEFGEEFIFSQPRIGKTIYGLIHKEYDFVQEAISFKLKISQINFVKKDEIVGYNGYKILEDSYIGVVNYGYNHGFQLSWINNLTVRYNNNFYKIISISMEYIIIDFKNTIISELIEVDLFYNGFVNYFINTKQYYLEQLLRFNNMDKKII